jgi:hypothetical protein
MLYVLLGGVLAHAVHWSDAMLLASAMAEPWRKGFLNPAARPRVLMGSPEMHLHEKSRQTPYQ